MRVESSLSSVVSVLTLLLPSGCGDGPALHDDGGVDCRTAAGEELELHFCCAEDPGVAGGVLCWEMLVLDGVVSEVSTREHASGPPADVESAEYGAHSCAVRDGSVCGLECSSQQVDLWARRGDELSHFPPGCSLPEGALGDRHQVTVPAGLPCGGTHTGYGEEEVVGPCTVTVVIRSTITWPHGELADSEATVTSDCGEESCAIRYALVE